MNLFSRRYNYDPATKEPILEDAPIWLRIAYFNILTNYTYIDKDSRFDNAAGKPLGIKSLYEHFCIILRQEPEEGYWDSWYCSDFLESLIKTSAWYNFYDFVEFVGKELQENEVSLQMFDSSLVVNVSFDSYRTQVNDLFLESRVEWRLSPKSSLIREVPTALRTRLEVTEEMLVDNFVPARLHYQKAVRYLYERPIDPENSIKEMVSAVESTGRILYPSTSTLGDVVKAMRKKNVAPFMLVTVIEKYYAFASSEPAVRHGAPVESKVLLRDAEFVLHVGIALIRYLRDLSK